MLAFNSLIWNFNIKFLLFSENFLYAYNVFWSSSPFIVPFTSSQIQSTKSSYCCTYANGWEVIFRCIIGHVPTLKENELYLSQKLWLYRVGAHELLSPMLKGRLALPAACLAGSHSCWEIMHAPALECPEDTVFSDILSLPTFIF